MEAFLKNKFHTLGEIESEAIMEKDIDGNKKTLKAYQKTFKVLYLILKIIIF